MSIMESQPTSIIGKQLNQAQNKEDIKAPPCLSFVRGIHRTKRISNVEGIFITVCHYVESLLLEYCLSR